MEGLMFSMREPGSREGEPMKRDLRMQWEYLMRLVQAL